MITPVTLKSGKKYVRMTSADLTALKEISTPEDYEKFLRDIKVCLIEEEGEKNEMLVL